jgi:hypothetical protein
LEISAKSGLSVLATGRANHIALIDMMAKRLLYVTTCPEQELSAGGVVSIASWSVAIGAPA